MPETTPNINLIKPLLPEFFSLEHFNPNWDTLDALFSAVTGHDHLAAGAPVRRLRAGTLASRPDIGQVGEVYYATDTKQLFFGTGTGWDEVSGGGGGSQVLYLAWTGL